MLFVAEGVDYMPNTPSRVYLNCTSRCYQQDCTRARRYAPPRKVKFFCRLCGKFPESVPHVLAGCPALAQNKYPSRHNTALKILFFELPTRSEAS